VPVRSIHLLFTYLRDTVISARATGGPAAIPVPYQRGPPQEYLEAVTNKRLTEEVGGV